MSFCSLLQLACREKCQNRHICKLIKSFSEVHNNFQFVEKRLHDFSFVFPGETPVKPVMPVEDPPPSDMLPGKKKYIPPYTPNRTKSYTPTVPTPHRTSTASSNYKPRSVPSSSGASSSKMSSQINRPIASASIQQHSQLKNIKKFSKPMTEEEELEVESNKF